jgi:hypothetical protein
VQDAALLVVEVDVCPLRNDRQILAGHNSKTEVAPSAPVRALADLSRID